MNWTWLGVVTLGAVVSLTHVEASVTQQGDRWAGNSVGGWLVLWQRLFLHWTATRSHLSGAGGFIRLPVGLLFWQVFFSSVPLGDLVFFTPTFLGCKICIKPGLPVGSSPSHFLPHYLNHLKLLLLVLIYATFFSSFLFSSFCFLTKTSQLKTKCEIRLR